MSGLTVTIYGFGYVGQAVWRFLKDHYSVQIFDPNSTDEGVINDFEKVVPSRYAVVCVPTQQLPDGSCDTSLVLQTIRDSQHELYLIKSTVEPKTTMKISEETHKRVVFSPEYIGEGKYPIPYWKDMPHPTDMKLHNFYIFGGKKADTTEWVNVWQKPGGWEAKYMQTDSTTAELVKYMVNSFLATKKIFCDEFYNIAQAMGVNYSELRELWLLDGRMGRANSLIYPDKRGYADKCLPKDVAAIIKAAENAGYDPKLMKQVAKSNDEFRNK